MIVVPDYYKEFKCIAGACKHTCCAGWEIDIDPVSLERFKKDGIENICLEDDPHFILQAGNRCPNLRPDGLCRMIIERGPDYICDICADHPRFRNFWTGITEIGLGLSCEAAAELILGKEKPMQLTIMSESERRGLPANEPVSGKALQMCGINTGEEKDPLPSLEELVNSLPEDERYLWDIRSQVLRTASELDDPIQARLAEYFAYRQIPDALYDGKLQERINFVWRSVNEITERWNRLENQDFKSLAEVARSYSEYIEYNPERLQNMLV